jgi:hypothetical protein
MKANILALVIIAVIFGLAVSGALGQTQHVPAVNLITEKEGIGGEHAPLVWTGSDTISSSANFGAYTTSWMQIGSDYMETNLNNRVESIFNPENFTVSILKKHAFATAADSCYLSSARFEIADSSGAVIPFWNSDSSNLFIGTGNYTRSDYGSWTFLPDTITTRRYVYPLRVFQGAYIRFVFESSAEDCTIVNWTLKCEN